MLMKLILATIVLFAVQHCAKLVYYLGYHRHSHNHYPGPCQVVKDMGHGSENAHMFSDGLTFITSGYQFQYDERKVEYLKIHNITGKIYLFDFKTREVKVEEVKIIECNGFKMKLFGPHGMSGWEDKKTGRRYIFVVNHELGGEDYIEKFLYLPKKKQLKHLKRYHDGSTMDFINDVQATGEDSYYFTTFGRNIPVLNLQFIIRYAWNTVVHYDGQTYNVVLDNMPMPNGIAMSNDGRFVFINGNLHGELMVYTRNPDNSLTNKQSYPLYTTPDNLFVDKKTGDVYIASQPVMYSLLQHLADPAIRTASQVLHLKVQHGKVIGIKELFYDDGSLITASSMPIVYDSKLLIGSILDTLVYCDIKVPM